MAETNGLHIANTVIISLIFINSFIATIGLYLFAQRTASVDSFNFFNFIFIDPITMILFFSTVLTGIFLIFLIMSYFGTNINNNLFRLSAKITIVSIILFLIGIVLSPIVWVLIEEYDWYGKYYSIQNGILYGGMIGASILSCVLLLTSLTVFVVGYYKNKN